jgi:PAS domain S-box-containing protein
MSLADGHSRSARELLRALVDSLPDLIYVKDAGGRYLVSNRAHTAYVGAASEADVLGRTALDFFPREIAERFTADDHAVLHAGEPMIEREECFTRYGVTAWYATTKVPMRDDQGRCTGVIGIKRDITARKQTQQALLESESFSRRMVDASRDIIWEVEFVGLREIWDAIVRGEIQAAELLAGSAPRVRVVPRFISPAVTRMLGFTPAEALALPPQRKFTPSSWQLLCKADSEVLADCARDPDHPPDPPLLELEEFHKDGTIIHTESARQVLRDEAGRPTGMMGLTRDVSARRAAEEVLRADAMRLGLTAKAANVGMWDWNLLSNETYFSPEWKQQIGYAPDELPNRYEEWETRLHPEDRLPVLTVLKDFLKERRRDYEVEFRLRHRDGSWRWIISRGEVYRDRKGKPLRMLGCHVDVTERKEAQLRLAESEARYRTLVSSSPDAIAMHVEGMVTFANPAFAALLGAGNPDGLIGRPMLDIVHPDDHRLVQGRWEALWHGRAVEPGEQRFVRGDGTFVEVETNTVAVGDPGRRELLVIARNITTRKEAERRLERVSRLDAARRHISSILVRIKTPEELYDHACRVAVEDGGLAMALVVMLPPGSSKAAVAAQCGASREHLEGFDVRLDDETAKGTVATALRTGQPDVCNDVAGDARMAPWREGALRHGLRAIASFPLKVADRTVAALVCFAPEAGFFDEDEFRLLQAVALDVSYALASIESDRERDLARERLLQVQKRSELIIENSLDAIVAIETSGSICLWNAQAEQLFGWSRGEALGLTLTDTIIPERMHEAHRHGMRRYLESGGRTILGRRIELVARHRDGHEFPVELSVSPIKVGEHLMFFASIRDITARKEAERSLREMTGHLLEVQDEERRAIGRELHDSTAQTLSALSMNLGMFEDVFPDLGSEGARLVQDCCRLLESAMSEVRTVSYLLHPPMLDELGLVAALRWYAHGFKQRTKIEVMLDLPPELPRLAKEQELAVYRLVQEGLGNIHRHSGSATARIGLIYQADRVQLEISDSGRGLPAGVLDDLAHGGSTLGVGLAGMRERARLLGGSLELASGQQGTTVRFVIPIRREGP